MGFKVSFITNQNITDEDINAIGYNLSNTVYTSFTNDTLYGVDSLNEITSHLMSKGVKRGYENECAITINEGVVHIGSGLAFFDNGATISIDGDGIDLTFEESMETQYIYLFFNESLNVAGARCSVVLPETGVCYVMLGTVTGGILTQNRTFAYLNADVKGTNEVVTVTVEAEHYKDENEKLHFRYIVPFNVTKYQMVYFRPTLEENAAEDLGVLFGAYDIQNQQEHFYVFGYRSSSSWTETLVTSGNSISIVDGQLILDMERILNRVYPSNEKLVFEFYGGVAE